MIRTSYARVLFFSGARLIVYMMWCPVSAVSAVSVILRSPVVVACRYQLAAFTGLAMIRLLPSARHIAADRFASTPLCVVRPVDRLATLGLCAGLCCLVPVVRLVAASTTLI